MIHDLVELRLELNPILIRYISVYMERILFWWVSPYTSR